MELSEFISRLPNFGALTSYEKIHLFAWYLHTHRGADVFDNAAIRSCFVEVHAVCPDVSVYLPRMAAKRPPEVLRNKSGYRLEGSTRRRLDEKYGGSAALAPMTTLLLALPSKVSNLNERTFLTEAIDCYRVRAFRAAIVMTWNLSFDHLTHWIFSDSTRLLRFNASLPIKYPAKKAFTIKLLDDFSELKSRK
jgi:hypothetical protein